MPPPLEDAGSRRRRRSYGRSPISDSEPRSWADTESRSGLYLSLHLTARTPVLFSAYWCPGWRCAELPCILDAEEIQVCLVFAARRADIPRLVWRERRATRTAHERSQTSTKEYFQPCR